MHQHEEPHIATTDRYTLTKIQVNAAYVQSLSNLHHACVLCRSSAEPCSPSQLTVSVNCSSNSAKLAWQSSPNAVSYTGKAISADGHSVTCSTTTELSCNLEGLQCGKMYNFTVSASDYYCQSPDSKPVIHTTGKKQ